MQFIKVKSNQVFTPIVTLSSKGRRVVVVGTIHLASRQYFSYIEQVLVGRQNLGWLVLYESLTDNENDMFHPDPHCSRLLKQVTKMHIKLVHLLMERCFLVYQSDFLKIRPTWINADVEIKTKQKISSLNTFEGLKTAKKNLRAILKNPDLTIERMIKDMLDEKIYVQKVTKINSMAKKHLITVRDKMAVRKIASRLKKHSVITFWGVAHVLGIVDGLKERGFRQVHVRWIKAFSINPPPLR